MRRVLGGFNFKEKFFISQSKLKEFFFKKFDSFSFSRVNQGPNMVKIQSLTHCHEVTYRQSSRLAVGLRLAKALDSHVRAGVIGVDLFPQRLDAHLELRSAGVKNFHDVPFDLNHSFKLHAEPPARLNISRKILFKTGRKLCLLIKESFFKAEL
ncbi:hypothetical protein [Desulfovibrio sp. ZJ200]|uniref:hypothetical protein n=1 Tax=Desulfovibrio sp. ZJ200 TaxID=2709792 RepID=UPI001981D4D1|nr:hypothetical protein [Desulfovibrio sp. ZJ200]